MHPLTRSAVTACLGLAFLVVPAAAGHAATAHPNVAFTQCNGDPGFDASNDPVHCHYQHPLPTRHWRATHHHHW